MLDGNQTRNRFKIDSKGQLFSPFYFWIFSRSLKVVTSHRDNIIVLNIFYMYFYRIESSQRESDQWWCFPERLECKIFKASVTCWNPCQLNQLKFSLHGKMESNKFLRISNGLELNCNSKFNEIRFLCGFPPMFFMAKQLFSFGISCIQIVINHKLQSTIQWNDSIRLWSACRVHYQPFTCYFPPPTKQEKYFNCQLRAQKLHENPPSGTLN